MNLTEEDDPLKTLEFMLKLVVFLGLLGGVFLMSHWYVNKYQGTRAIVCKEETYFIHVKYLSEHSFMHYGKVYPLDGCEVWESIPVRH